MIQHSLKFFIFLATTALMAAQQIDFEAAASQTSLWPGDRFDYRITLRVPAGFRVALQDFDETSVNFEPFVLLGTSRQQETLDEDLVRYRISYQLANYETGDRQLEIPRMVFRYEDGSAAQSGGPSTQEMQIPPFPVAIKSTLNVPLEKSWIRESLASDKVLIFPSWILVLGVAGLFLSSFPLLGWIWRSRPLRREGQPRLGRREFSRKWQTTLDGLAGSKQNPKEDFASIDELIREFFRSRRQIEAGGLTGREISAALSATEAVSRQEQLLIEILQHGERCRYGPDDAERWQAVLREDLETMRKTAL